MQAGDSIHRSDVRERQRRRAGRPRNDTSWPRPRQLHAGRLRFASMPALVACALVAACNDPDPIVGRGGVRVEVAYDPDVDFAQYQTFALRSDSELTAGMLVDLGERSRDELDLINDLVAGELEAIGLTQVEPEEADLLAFSLTRTRNVSRLDWVCVPGVYWDGYWYWGYYLRSVRVA